MQYLFCTSDLKRILKEINTAGDTCGYSCDGSRLTKSPLVDLLSKLTSPTTVGRERAVKDLVIFAEREDADGNAKRCKDAMRALQMVERTRALFSSLGFREFSTEHTRLTNAEVTSYTRILRFWLKLYMIGKAESFAKHQSVSMFNLVHKQEALPESELYGCELGFFPSTPRQKRFLRKKLIHMKRWSTKRRYQFTQNFLYFKKGCPVSSDEMKAESLSKHRKAMEKVPKANLIDDNKVPDSVERRIKFNNWLTPHDQSLRERVRRICEKVFRNYKHPTEWWTPSPNASFESSSAKGGCLGLATTIDLDEGTNLKVVEKPPKLTEYLLNPWCCCPEREFSGECWGTCFRVGDETEFISLPNRCFVDFPVTSRVEARPVALPEPLKVRVITAESGWCSYALKGAQKSLWECLHRFHWFTLTGRPCCSDDIPRLSIEEIEKGIKWISVDYKAATDNLSKHFTAYVLEQICRICDLPYDLCLESLCGHKIRYTDLVNFKKSYTEIEQQNGQLMGSILSFIVLCICNAAILSLTCSPHQVDFDLAMLVNGDDGLFKGTQDDFKTWAILAGEVGLENSIGKTYFSDEFCVINSELFYRINDNEVADCPYANMTGLSPWSAGSANKIKDPLELASAHKAWIRGFSESGKDIRLAAESLWYRTHYDVLHLTKMDNISWHLRPNLGGLGIPLPLDGSKDDMTVSPYQQFRVRNCIDQLKKKGVVRPYISMDMSELKDESSSEFVSESEGTMRAEALNHIFGGQPLSDTYLGKLPCVPETTVKAAKVIGLTGGLSVRFQCEGQGWLKVQEKQKKLASLGFLQTCFIEKKQPLELADDLRYDLEHRRDFYYHRKMTREFGANRDLKLKDLHRIDVEVLETDWRIKLLIPENEKYPWMQPYRAYLEQVINWRKSPVRLADDQIRIETHLQSGSSVGGDDACHQGRGE